MRESYEYIRQLYIEKLTGVISQDDEINLQRLLAQYPDLRHYWDLLEAEGLEINAKEVIAGIDTTNELQIWRKRVLDDQQFKQSYAWWKWSAAAIFLLGLSFYFFQNVQEEIVEVASTNTSHEIDSWTDSRILLELENEESIVLTKNQEQVISVGGMLVKISDGQLHIQGVSQSGKGMNRLYVPATEDYGVILSDGTRIFLNSDTELKFPSSFDGNTREVFLKGEAYFEVAENPKKTFLVHAEDAEIKVTGTSFNVSSYEGERFRTSLLEGEVYVSSKVQNGLRLVPGQEAVFTTSGQFQVSRFDQGEVLSWRNGTYFFHQKQLGELSTIIHRWFGVQVIFEKESLMKKPVSGLLEKGYLKDFLNDLKTTTGINYSLKDSILVLK